MAKISTLVNSEHQSILDVFLLQGLINYQDYQNLKDRLRSNLEVESFLIKSKLISRDSVNRAYSIILKIPYVELKNYRLPDEAKKLINEEFVRRFMAIPFAFKGGQLNLAVADPGNLEKNRSGLEQYFGGKVNQINLYITGTDDLESARRQFVNQSDNQLLYQAKYPTVYLKNQVIAKEVLSLLPIDFMIKYHLVIFGRRDEKNYLIASDRVDNPETLKAIAGVEDKNNIIFEIFATSNEDLSFIFNQLTSSNNQKDELPAKLGDSGVLKNLKGMMAQSDSKKITVDSVEKSIAKDQSSTPASLQAEPAGAKPAEFSAKEDVVESGKETPIVEPKPEENHKTDDAGEKENLLKDKVENIGELIDHDITDKAEFEKLLKNSEVPKMVAAMISYALSLRSSDIHLEPELKDLRVRFRVDGILQDISAVPLAIHPQIISRIKILSNLKLDESRIPQDGRFDVFFHQKQVDIRVSTLPTVRGEKIVMRLLDKSQGILSLEDLGIVGRSFKSVVDAISKPYGIIISTGPTGSGKSTSLYAILNRISVPAVNIVTLEDPVEYEIPGINQCQIKPKIGFTFADGLRSILRQDPNVIMVGEVRDLETANMATHAALTGHLVLTTLHTNDAAGALPRLINMGVEPFLITSSINLIIAQRLVRRICPKCREEIKLPDNLLKQLEAELALLPKNNKEDLARLKSPLKFYQGRGCNECGGGYRGRLGIFESLRVTDEIEELVIAKRPASEIQEAAMKDGMITMRHDGILKALAGLTTVDEVLRVTTAFV